VIAINFPVLEINPTQSYIAFTATENELTKCYDSAITKTSYFKDLYILDSSGTKRKVIKVEKVGNIGPFGGLTWSLQRWVRVRLEYSEPEDLDLTQAKSFLSSVIDRNPDHWEASVELSRIKKIIRDAQSFADLMNLFSTALK
jgi:hypothetical protein